MAVIDSNIFFMFAIEASKKFTYIAVINQKHRANIYPTRYAYISSFKVKFYNCIIGVTTRVIFTTYFFIVVKVKFKSQIVFAIVIYATAFFIYYAFHKGFYAECYF